MCRGLSIGDRTATDHRAPGVTDDDSRADTLV
jgi:hypothetical protein